MPTLSFVIPERELRGLKYFSETPPKGGVTKQMDEKQKRMKSSAVSNKKDAPKGRLKHKISGIFTSLWPAK